MDSLTQIILGAAVGEAALGKKVGNRAMVWGAIAGTIPDLDVVSNLFMSPIDALAFHRGPTHSAFYLTIFSFIIGWAVHKFYQQKWQKWVGISCWIALLLATCGSLVFFSNGSYKIILIALTILILGGFTIYKRYTRNDYKPPLATARGWQWLFFLSLVTHPILDCFTTYGTQILIPFSSQRVAFNNIAVADPLYTVPFMTCLIIAMFYSRTNPQRAVWNNRGLIISTFYMILTIFNKSRIDTIFENSLVKENVNFTRYMTTPSILNNVLWSGIAETDSAYFYGAYSFFDAKKSFTLKRLPKDTTVVNSAISEDQTLKTLLWFSDGYYDIKRQSASEIEYYDLRFGSFKKNAESPEEFVFKFNLSEKPKGKYTLLGQGNSPRDANFKEVFSVLWDRMMGRN